MEERLTLEAYGDRISQIKSSLEKHLGQKVLLIARDGRMRIPIIATLERSCGKYSAQYRNYAKDGTQAATRSMYVNPLLIHTGELTLDYFDDGV